MPCLLKNNIYSQACHKKNGAKAPCSLILFANGNSTFIEERFEAENMNSRELQLSGWQAILNNFKKYIESL
jgi:hypothetical protein